MVVYTYVKEGLGNKLWQIMKVIAEHPGEKIFYANHKSAHEKASDVPAFEALFPAAGRVLKRISWPEFDAARNVEDISSTVVHPDHINSYDRKWIRYAHTSFFTMAPEFRPKLPFVPNDSDVVIHARFGDKVGINHKLRRHKHVVCKPEFYDHFAKVLQGKTAAAGRVLIYTDSPDYMRGVAKRLNAIMGPADSAAHEILEAIRCFRNVVLSDSTLSMFAVAISHKRNVNLVYFDDGNNATAPATGATRITDKRWLLKTW